MKRVVYSLACCIVVLGTLAATVGGWAVVTVENPPERLVAGRPIEFTFMVRQHGVSPMPDLKPRVEARSGRRVVHGTAWSTPRTGAYRARITVPDAREWQITIHSGFGRSRGSLLPLMATDSTAPATPLAQDDRGRFLFAAKGCVTCHVHRDVDITGEVAGSGPELTNLRFAAHYLARFLADPSIKPATRPYYTMPNLNLDGGDIASLVAFINSERRLTAK